jgi:hypothetical protein
VFKKTFLLLLCFPRFSGPIDSYLEERHGGVLERTMFDSDYDVETHLNELREKWAQDRDLAAKARQAKVRSQAARKGYRLMHRRSGQYWVLFGSPMTLDEIEAWMEPHTAQ